MKKIIHTKNSPAPIGPYNQAVIAGNLLYTSGQIPIDPATGEMVEGGVREQALQSMKNLKGVFAAAGCTLEAAIKVTVFLADMNDFPVVNEIYAEFFNEETAPARSTVQVARLPKDSLVEIEAIALLD